MRPRGDFDFPPWETPLKATNIWGPAGPPFGCTPRGEQPMVQRSSDAAQEKARLAQAHHEPAKGQALHREGRKAIFTACKGEVTSPVAVVAIPRCARRKEKYRQTERQAVFLFTPSAALFLFGKTKRKRGAEKEIKNKNKKGTGDHRLPLRLSSCARRRNHIRLH